MTRRCRSRRRVLGADHLDTATSLNNLALLYKTQGRYEDAAPLYDEALDDPPRAGGGITIRRNEPE